MAELILAATAAAGVAAAAAALAAARRRARAADACHELRRPLQVLALACEREPDRADLRQPLLQAARALAQLELALTGAEEPSAAAGEASVEALLADAVARWHGAGAVRAAGAAPRAGIEADPVAVGATLDNLIANALEHGDGEGVEIGATAGDGPVRLWVRNGPPRPGRPRRITRSPQRGRGLAIAERLALGLGGRLERPRLTGRGVEAAIELPRGSRS